METFASDFILALIFLIGSMAVSALDLSINAAEQTSNVMFGIDLSIEGLRSYKFSVAIFVFLVISLILFSYIIYLYWPKKDTKIRIGEKIMLGSIIFGMFLAVVIGWIQLIEGYLI